MKLLKMSVFFAILAIFSLSTAAAVTIVTKPTTINSSGVYVLGKDINGSISIRADNVLLDGNGHSIKPYNESYKSGLSIYGDTNVTVKNITILNWYTGLDVNKSTNVRILNCNLTNNYYGLKISNSPNSEVVQCKFRSYGSALTVSNSNYAKLSNCSISNIEGGEGLTIFKSNHVSVYKFDIIGCYEGINISSSNYTTLSKCSSSGNGYNFKVTGKYLSNYVNYIDTSNTVNGKPMYYLVNVSNYKVPSDAGFVAAITCNNISVENLSIESNYDGVLFVNTFDSNISNVKVSSCFNGIREYQSTSNTIKNVSSSENENGFYIEETCMSKIVSSKAKENNNYGIFLNFSDKNTIENCTANYNDYGITLFNSNNNEIKACTANNNYGGYGIYLKLSNNNIVDNCSSSANGVYEIYTHKYRTSVKFFLNGDLTLDSSNSNLVENCTFNSHTFNGVYLYNSSNNALKDLTTSDNYLCGVFFDTSPSNTLNGLIEKNSEYGLHSYKSNFSSFNRIVVLNNYYGVFLERSFKNSLTNCSAKNNTEGIYTTKSNESKLYRIKVTNNSYGFYLTSPAILNVSLIANNEIGVLTTNTFVGYNLIVKDNVYGIYSEFNASIFNSTFSGNGVSQLSVEAHTDVTTESVLGAAIYTSGKLTIHFSNIYPNNNYTIYNAGNYIVNASYNYWGTNNTTAVNSSVYGSITISPLLLTPAVVVPLPEAVTIVFVLLAAILTSIAVLLDKRIKR